MADGGTPSYDHLPKPQQFIDAQTLSTKKARGTPHSRLPFCPPTVKSAPPNSRLRLFTFTRDNCSFPRTPLISEYDSDITGKELYFDSAFVNYGLLGKGSFGEVFKMKSIEDGKFYAVKRTGIRRGRRCNRPATEVCQFQKLPNHPNVIKFHKSWQTDDHSYIQMELCDTTLSYFCEENHDIPESLVWKYFVDLLLAVKHLHDHDLVHMDIKPANIFISKFNVCKLGDFGLVLDLKSDAQHDASEGDAKYVSAEAMMGYFTKAADIFSLGITILEMACDLDLPDKDVVWQDLRRGRLPHNLMTHISPELTAVIQSMMLEEYLKRPTADDLLALPRVVDVWHKRKRIYATANTLVSVLNMIHSCLHHVSKFFNFIFKPFKSLCNETGKYVTPKQSPKPNLLHCPDIDDYGDDEIFGKTEDISPACSLNGDKMEHYNSTPTSRRKKTLRKHTFIHTPIQPKILFSESSCAEGDDYE